MAVYIYICGKVISLLEQKKYREECIVSHFFSFIFISWRLITLQYCSGFCHTLTWISHGFTCIAHPDPPSHLPLDPIPLLFHIFINCCNIWVCQKKIQRTLLDTNILLIKKRITSEQADFKTKSGKRLTFRIIAQVYKAWMRKYSVSYCDW